MPILGVTANAQPHKLALFKFSEVNFTLVKPITSAALAFRVKEMCCVPTKFNLFPETRQSLPIVELEIFNDMQAAMTSRDLLAFCNEALSDAEAALTDVSGAQLDTTKADQIHKAAGPVAMIGAVKLHMLLCALEDSLRAGEAHMIAPLLNNAMKAKQDTTVWILAALPLG